MSNPKRTVGILIFPQVEVLDFAGPFEVFSRTRLEGGVESRRTDESAPFEVFTVAKQSQELEAVGGLRISPTRTFDTAPKIDILVIPGGFGTRPLLEDEDTLRWIAATSHQAEQTTSVCTGALLLAKLGLLAHKRATTHWGALEVLSTLDPSIVVEQHQRVVTDGVITSAGVSAGIDMAFSVVESLHGKTVADETAHYIEFLRR